MAEFGTWVAVLLYAYDRTGPASVGIVALVQLVPAALAAPPAAALGDRFPRHRVLFGGYVVQAFATGLTAAMMVIEAPVVVVYAGGGVRRRVGGRRPADPERDAPVAVADARGADGGERRGGVVEGTGVLLGPLLAAARPDRRHAGRGLRPGGGRRRARGPPRGRGPARDATASTSRTSATPVKAPSSGSFMTGLRVLLGDPDARVVVGLLTMRMLMIGAADVLFVLLALEALGMGAPGAAILNAALGAGTIVGGIVTFGFVGRSRLSIVAAGRRGRCGASRWPRPSCSASRSSRSA